MPEEMLPDVYFGSAQRGLVDWRTKPEEPDPDDTLLDKTPEDVVLMLGFDPLELLEEE